MLAIDLSPERVKTVRSAAAGLRHGVRPDGPYLAGMICHLVAAFQWSWEIDREDVIALALEVSLLSDTDVAILLDRCRIQMTV